LIWIEAQSSACWEKNEKKREGKKRQIKKKWPGAFFSRPETDMHFWWNFMAVRYN
jgi:hypothetical protein